LTSWGSFNDPEHCDYTYANRWTGDGKMFVTLGVVDGKLVVVTDLVDINLTSGFARQFPLR
jgi:hydrogenase large subunit